MWWRCRRSVGRVGARERGRRAYWPAIAFACVGLGQAPLHGQRAEWNDERSLRLIELGRERRQLPQADSLLTSYRASAEAFIYFLLDQEGGAQPLLLRSDQVALQLYWTAPDQSRQVILGMRSRKQLPIRDFNYYLDRFTVIQNGFEDEIVVGSGHDVRSVVHPLAPLGPATYDYRLVDSVTLRLPGRSQPVSVYELQVRPRELHRPGFVGSVFLERGRGDLVRLAFTFTPASYIDPRNERVEIVLENGLWVDRYWLPHEQRLLVRRELPELELGVGTVIRAVLAVGEYWFNEEQPAPGIAGRWTVTTVPRDRLESYPFEHDLLSGLGTAGVAALASPDSLLNLDFGKLAAMAAALPGSGMPPFRLFLPGISSVLRYNRSEGLVTGLGVSYRPGRAGISVLTGYGWGDGRPRLQTTFSYAGSPVRLATYLNRSLELAPGTPEAGLLSSATALTLGSDYQDPFLASGVALGCALRAAGGELSLGILLERQRPGGLVDDAAPLQPARDMRPVLDGERGIMLLGSAALGRELLLPPGPAAKVSLEVETGAWEAQAFARGGARIQLEHATQDGQAGGSLTGAAGVLIGHAAARHLYFIGGRGTLPGYPYRSFVGDRFLLSGADCWYMLAKPWLGVRLLAGAGWTGSRSDAATPVLAPGPGSWNPAPAGGVRGYWGAGVALLDRLLRVDYAIPWDRNTGQAHWLVSIDPRLHPML